MANQMGAHIRLGQSLHKAVESWLKDETGDISSTFHNRWLKYRTWKLLYNPGEDWDKLHGVGMGLALKFPGSFMSQGITAGLSEDGLSYFSDATILKRRPDLIAKKGGRVIVVDFKYSIDPWTQKRADMSEQLTETAMVACQALMEDPPIEVAICNLCGSTGEIRWFYGKRGTSDFEKVCLGGGILEMPNL